MVMMRVVQPVAHERFFAGRGLGLRYLVVVVDGDMVDAAGVDIYLFAEQRKYHRGALDMPAGEAFAPRRVPAQHCSSNFHNAKSAGISFFGIRFDARTLFERCHIDAAELAVAGKFGRVKIDAVARLVGVAFFFERFDERYLFADIVARTRE